MGSMTFTRKDDGRKASFDSSPAYTLPKMFGWAEGTVRLDKVDETAKAYTYSVYARTTPEAKEHMVGTLVQKTRNAIWAGLSR